MIKRILALIQLAVFLSLSAALFLSGVSWATTSGDTTSIAREGATSSRHSFPRKVSKKRQRSPGRKEVSLSYEAPYFFQKRPRELTESLEQEQLRKMFEREAKIWQDPNRGLNGLYPDKANVFTQADIRPWMLPRLIEWMSALRNAFQLSEVSFELAVRYLHGYLSLEPALRREDLQLVGMVSLYFAELKEESVREKRGESLHIEELLAASDHAYDKSQFLGFHRHMLDLFNGKLERLLAGDFVDYFLRLAKREDPDLRSDIYRFLNATYLIDFWIGFRPSQMAATAIQVALSLRDESWGSAWQTLTHYTAADLGNESPAN